MGINKGEEHMNELTQAGLEAALIEICKHIDEMGEKTRVTPTKIIVRPADLEALGLTVGDVMKMIKEKNT